ncbi:CdaR family transcriptional regulator [Amycolatopsis sp. GM8]|uniref:PucR family transcriptional regulator n=1 Tax=Amycolatopsis sp. GM8 TaxID=2896530 RepID=UPI001F34024C|nr:helix-turn-helix domain-containing protein [Amycolatopsis sp. GM8]
MSKQPLAPLDLAELLRVEPLSRASAVHLPDPARHVHEVVLAETFDRLHHAAPHSLVVLHHEAATGGWALAAALHAGWERNVSAIVVPRPAMSSSSAVLAERLGIALLVIEDEPVDVALTLAGQVSAPQAARALRVALCAERLAEQSSIRGVLGVLNSELAPVPVALTVGGTVTAGRAAGAAEKPGGTTVCVEINAAGRPWAELVAAVPAKNTAAAGHVESVLRLARLPLLAAWAQTRVHSSAQAAREQAAFGLLRRLVAEPAAAAEPADVEVPPWTGELGWRVEGRNRAVWISPLTATDGAPAEELTQLVRAAWQRHRPDWPLVADSDGWISWQNLPDSTENNDEAGMRRALGAVTHAAESHALVLGVGDAHRGVPGLMRSVTEARLAAHVARDGGPGSVQWFDQVGARAALAWLPRGQIAEVADLCLAGLMAARDREALVDTVLAVLDCGGSLSQASARLGVHRNTVLSRVARAKELGLVFDDPARRLALHVLCYSLASVWLPGRS